MEVINLDKNGNVIPDLSKKVIPKDLSDMTQAELSRLLNINRQQVNRAIKGDNSPKAIEIRKKIYRVLNM